MEGEDRRNPDHANTGDPPGKGDPQGSGRRGRNAPSMDVFGGTEGQAVILVAVLLYVIQNLTTWVNSNCTC